nr:hypothetical protein [uncultured Roseococcus sp.]
MSLPLARLENGRIVGTQPDPAGERAHLLRLSWGRMDVDQQDQLLLAAEAILARKPHVAIPGADDDYALQRGIAAEMARVIKLEKP